LKLFKSEEKSHDQKHSFHQQISTQHKLQIRRTKC
jgi:hypothetical protein